MKPSNQSLIMVYKIVYDYEKNNKTTHTLQELSDFTSSVLDYVNNKRDQKHLSIDIDQTKQYVQRICDIYEDQCIINVDRYNNSGKYFADKFLSCMTYDILEGCLAIVRSNDIVNTFRENFLKLSPSARIKYLNEYGFNFGKKDETNEQSIN